MAKAGRRRSLWFRRDIKARESSGISVEEAFEALRLGEISMDVVQTEGRGPKIELVDSSLEKLRLEVWGKQQHRVKGAAGGQGCESAGS